jgi:hypothetical protein
MNGVSMPGIEDGMASLGNEDEGDEGEEGEE